MNIDRVWAFFLKFFFEIFFGIFEFFFRGKLLAMARYLGMGGVI
jgi:hypothetical protein